MPRSLIYLLCLVWLCLGATPATQPSDARLRPGKDYALFFALEQYQEWSPLRYPIDEAQTLARELKTKYGFQTEIVPNPTQSEIYETLERYRNLSYDADAQLLIFFSGHGEFVENTKEGFFIPEDAQRDDFMQRSYLPHARLKSWVNSIPCGHILLAIDACFSGTFDDRIAGSKNDDDTPSFGRPGSGEGPSQAEQQGYLHDNLQYQTRFYLTSGGKEKTPDRSQFARQFLEALRSTTRQHPILTFTQLKGHLEKAKPLPRAGEFGFNEPGLRNFLFARTPESFSTIPTEPAIPPISVDRSAWQKARNCDQIACYRAYLNTYARGRFVEAAKAEIERLALTDLPYLPQMIRIPGGSFQMGSEEGEDDEKPVHRVAISSFELAAYEVTVAQFKAFVEATGYKTDAEKDGGSYFWIEDEWKKKAGTDWRCDAEGNKRSSTSYDHPVIHVSWNDAQAYCKWLSDQTGQKWRLPTEAEWEYVAGNGAKHTRYSWGNGTPQGKQGGNVADESKSPTGLSWSAKFEGYNDGYWFTAPVGSYAANEFGLYDMSGNVWEWCQDWYSSSYYASSPSQDPQGPASGSLRVCRGGSWDNYPQFLRVAFRDYWGPVIRNGSLGFRPARSLKF